MKKVLDHGLVRLVDHMGSDISVVRSARVSYDADWRAGDDAGSDKRLINYLWRNKHSTPFESVTFTFEVKAPIFVLRQWMRHRTMSYNEVSARYTTLPCEMYVPTPQDVTTQSTDNKQMRTNTQHPQTREILNIIGDTCRGAYRKYEELLALGCPRELARCVLPLNTYSHMFCTVNLLNLFKFLRLREAIKPKEAHAQHEIQVYAEAMLELIRPIVPVCVGAFENV